MRRFLFIPFLLIPSLVCAMTLAGVFRLGAVSGSGTTVYAPYAPTGVSATPGDTLNTITWTAGGTDSGHSATTSFDLLWGTSAGSEPNTITGVTSPYSHTGRTNGTAYYYKVRAINSAGSADSSETNATPVASGSYIAQAEFNGAGVDSGFASATSGGGTVAVTGGYAQLRGTTNADASMIRYGTALPANNTSWTVRIKGKYYGSDVTNMGMLHIIQQASAPAPSATNDSTISGNARVDVIVRPSAGYLIQYKDTTGAFPRWTAGSSNWNTGTGFTGGAVTASTDYVYRLENNSSSQFRVSVFTATDTTEASPIVQTGWVSWSLVYSGSGSYWLYVGDMNTEWDYVNVDIDYIRVQ